MVLGYFGRTPHEPDPEVVKIAAEQLKLEPTKESPLAINDRNPKKQVAHFREILKENNLPETDENIFIAAACGDKGIAFLKGEAKIGVRYKEKPAVKVTSGDFNVIVNGRAYQASLDGDKVTVNGKTFEVTVGPAGQAAAKPAATGGTGTEIASPVPGTVTKLLVKEGDAVKKAQPIAILEVMKMESPVPSPADGIVGKIAVHQGDQVITGQLLMTLN